MHRFHSACTDTSLHFCYTDDYILIGKQSDQYFFTWSFPLCTLSFCKSGLLLINWGQCVFLVPQCNFLHGYPLEVLNVIQWNGSKLFRYIVLHAAPLVVECDTCWWETWKCITCSKLDLQMVTEVAPVIRLKVLCTSNSNIFSFPLMLWIDSDLKGINWSIAGPGKDDFLRCCMWIESIAWPQLFLEPSSEINISVFCQISSLPGENFQLQETIPNHTLLGAGACSVV